jgi:hypothetical protein
MTQQPDIIGTIYKPTGETASEGLPVMAPIDGFHVNYPGEVPELAEYKPDPQPVTPYRVYAGGIMPVCYRFESKEQFESLLPEVGDETDQ